jgi:hypothetical protein
VPLATPVTGGNIGNNHMGTVALEQQLDGGIQAVSSMRQLTSAKLGEMVLECWIETPPLPDMTKPSPAFRLGALQYRQGIQY